MHEGFRWIDGADTLEDVPVWVNLFGPCACIGRAMGLGINLPDLTEEAETAALWRLPDDVWKDPFEGRIADTMRSGDHDWMRLADYPFGSAFFDLEEGVKFHTSVARLTDCLSFIASLGDRGVRLTDPEYMGAHAGETGSCVWISQAIRGGDVPDAEPAFKNIGLTLRGPNRRRPWVMPPGWRPPLR